MENVVKFVEQNSLALLKLLVLKTGQPRPLLPYFQSFSIKYYNFATNQCEKYSSRTWRLDSNSQPSDYESPPLTIRPGLPPNAAATFSLQYIFGKKTFSIGHLQLRAVNFVRSLSDELTKCDQNPNANNLSPKTLRMGIGCRFGF